MIESVNFVPNFDENGNLPLKCYEVTLDEIKEKFVDAFPNSKTRKVVSNVFWILLRICEKMLNHTQTAYKRKFCKKCSQSLQY